MNAALDSARKEMFVVLVDTSVATPTAIPSRVDRVVALFEYRDQCEAWIERKWSQPKAWVRVERADVAIGFRGTGEDVDRDAKPENMCRCGDRPATTEGHPCPYKADIDDDRETLCHCCQDCQDGCADDI